MIFNIRTKHIELDFHYIIENVLVGFIITSYLNTMTKSPIFLSSPLGVTELGSFVTSLVHITCMLLECYCTTVYLRVVWPKTHICLIVHVLYSNDNAIIECHNYLPISTYINYTKTSSSIGRWLVKYSTQMGNILWKKGKHTLQEHSISIFYFHHIS